MRTPNVTLRTVGFIDRRSEDLHARYDVIEQRRFAHRLARNHKERDRLVRRQQTEARAGVEIEKAE